MIELQHNSTENLYKLLENLLTWSRIQRGMIEYHPTPLDLRYLAKQNLELFQPNAAQKQITLHNAIIEPITVYADVNMVNTIIRNLCSNAIKFTPSGGTVTISATQTDDHEVEIAVADTGIGIKPDDLPKLFQIDTKYKRLGTDHEKGTGLGLILCKEFVEKHHGKIWVESTVDQGTTVRYTLPAESSA
jgi:signal transduction histidine kinase